MKASNLPLPVVFIILLILPALVLAPAARTGAMTVPCARGVNNEFP